MVFIVVTVLLRLDTVDSTVVILPLVTPICDSAIVTRSANASLALADTRLNSSKLALVSLISSR